MSLPRRSRLDHADTVVSLMRKELRKNKVLIDWSQNNPSKTTVAAYSLRALPQPTVSTPVTWDEVDACEKVVIRMTSALRRSTSSIESNDSATCWPT